MVNLREAIIKKNAKHTETDSKGETSFFHGGSRDLEVVLDNQV